MDNNFTTTFIPKKPMNEPAENEMQPVSRPAGILSSLSVILFFITILIAGGVFFWEKAAAANVQTLADSVTKVEKNFEPELITQLQTLDKQLKNGNTLLKNHRVITPVFDLLESSTLKQIRFTKFDLVFDDAKGPLVKMSGESDGYRSIAQQSDLLGANAYLKDTIFSNFFLTTKGKVSFDLSFGIRPDFIDFEKAPLTNPTPTL